MTRSNKAAAKQKDDGRNRTQFYKFSTQRGSDRRDGGDPPAKQVTIGFCYPEVNERRKSNQSRKQILPRHPTGGKF